MVVTMVRDSWELPSYTAGELHRLEEQRVRRAPRPARNGLTPAPVVPLAPVQGPEKPIPPLQRRTPASEEIPPDRGPDVQAELYSQDSLDELERSGFHPVAHGVWRRDYPDNTIHEVTYLPGYRRGGDPNGELAPWHLAHYPSNVTTAHRFLRGGVGALDVADQAQGDVAARQMPLHEAAQSPDDFYNDVYGGGTVGEEWRRFRVLPHPDAEPGSAGDITIAVKHHGLVPSWSDKSGKSKRPLYEVRVMQGENQVIPDTRAGKGQGHPFWGSETSYGDTPHEEVARTVAMDLGGDSYDIDAPLEHRDLYDPDRHHTEDDYPWAFGHGSSDFARDYMGGNRSGLAESVPYSEREKDFLRQYGEQLAHAGREPSDLERDGHPSTLAEEHLPPETGSGPAPRTPRGPRGRYGKKASFEWKDWTEL